MPFMPLSAYYVHTIDPEYLHFLTLAVYRKSPVIRQHPCGIVVIAFVGVFHAAGAAQAGDGVAFRSHLRGLVILFQCEKTI